MVDGDNYTYPAVTITGQIAELRAALVDLGRRVDDAEARQRADLDVLGAQVRDLELRVRDAESRDAHKVINNIDGLVNHAERIAALEREIAGLRGG